MTDDDVDSKPYAPRPGSVVWRVLNDLIFNPEAQLTRQDVATQYGCVLGGVDTTLQLPTARGCLIKTRNSQNLLVWKLGLVKTFRLDPMPTEIHIPHEQPDAVIGKGVPASKWSASAKPTGPAAYPRAQPVDTPRPAAIIAAPPPAIAPTAPLTAPAPAIPPLERAPDVAVIATLSPGQKIIGICNFKDTVLLATETGAFMYHAAAQEFRPIRFAAK